MSPRFSILMPTRNRPHLVRFALESALAQTLDDFEVVISDNSSNEETRAVVASFSDARIRYVRTDRVLGMPDNWDNTIKYASGEWLLLLEDDCALVPRCLETMSNAVAALDVELCSFDYYSYLSEDFPDPRRRVQFVLRPFDGTARRLNAHDVLEDMFAILRSSVCFPRPYNSVFRRSLVERLRARVGRVFPAPAPDYTFTAAALALTRGFGFVSAPLMLSSDGGGSTPHSSDAAFARFLTELDEDKKGGWAPIKLPVVRPCNIIVESICRMREALPELQGYSVDLAAYLVDYRYQLLGFEDVGFDTRFEMTHYREFLSRQSLRVRAEVATELVRRRARYLGWNRLKDLAVGHPALSRQAERISKLRLIRGSEHGFADIVGASRSLDGFVPRQLRA